MELSRARLARVCPTLGWRGQFTAPKSGGQPSGRLALSSGSNFWDGRSRRRFFSSSRLEPQLAGCSKAASSGTFIEFVHTGDFRSNGDSDGELDIVNSAAFLFCLLEGQSSD
uniref:(northern house mosquito) hypothetical protein n=1 Tax=Culex pipiens TaxID=7175 RepID=A0A8D8BE13_CULPI